MADVTKEFQNSVKEVRKNETKLTDLKKQISQVQDKYYSIGKLDKGTAKNVIDAAIKLRAVDVREATAFNTKTDAGVMAALTFVSNSIDSVQAVARKPQAYENQIDASVKATSGNRHFANVLR